MRIHIPEIGDVDDSTDLWSLFQTDAHGKTGLFAGQLMRELSERAPDWRPRLYELIRRGLDSDDGAERSAALHGALQLPATELGGELEQMSRRHREWLGSATSPAGRKVLALFLELLEREPQGSEAAIRALDQVRQMAGADSARAMVQLQPEAAVAALLSALDSGDSVTAAALAKPLSYTSRFADVTAEVARRSSDVKRRFLDVSYATLGADQFPAAYDRWIELGQSLGAPVDHPPARPVQSEASQRFADMLKSMVEAETKPATAPATGPVVLSAEVWVDGLRMPEGPPAQLFSLLEEKGRTILTSEALIRDIRSGLTRLGWPDPLLAEAEARVRQKSSLRSTAGAGSPDVELARDASVDTVFTVGPRTGTVESGVTFRPVHELLTSLQA